MIKRFDRKRAHASTIGALTVALVGPVGHLTVDVVLGVTPKTIHMEIWELLDADGTYLGLIRIPHDSD